MLIFELFSDSGYRRGENKVVMISKQCIGGNFQIPILSLEKISACQQYRYIL